MITEKRKTILIVDDTKINIDILIELLGNMYDIVVSLSAKRALTILETTSVDLILLDILMPDMSGYDVCRLLKAKEETQNIPVVFITSSTDEESIDQAFEVGGIDYITKPFMALELLARVKTHLNTQDLIQKLESSHSTMELLASQDHMTKLYNRRYFSEISENILELAKRGDKNLSIMMLDIDKFKDVNDTYGHHVGDNVIIALADLLKEFSRSSDIACRFGGEEFILLLPETSSEGAYLIAEKLRKKVEEFSVILADNSFLKFTVSIGVAEVEIHEDSAIERSIQRADTALYKAKESGRNLVCKN